LETQGDPQTAAHDIEVSRLLMVDPLRRHASRIRKDAPQFKASAHL
jgi:hypothetical protein